jgi:hypothetical protein
MITSRAVVYVPGSGEKVGMATMPVLVYIAVATALGSQSSLNALAFNVVVSVMVMGPVYSIESSVGSLPSGV